MELGRKVQRKSDNAKFGFFWLNPRFELHLIALHFYFIIILNAILIFIHLQLVMWLLLLKYDCHCLTTNLAIFYSDVFLF